MNNPGRPEGKRALVTGGNSGIGKSVALRLASEGAAVVVNCVAHPEQAEAVVQQINNQGVRAFSAMANISNESQVDRMFERACEEFAGMDILINKAGMETNHPFLEMPLEAWRKLLDIDLTGAFLCAQRTARLMVKMNVPGSIVNTSSVHQKIPWGGYAHYCAGKAAVDMLSKTAALELAAKNIRVNSVAPGAIATPINEDVWQDPQGYQGPDRKIPVARVGRTDDMRRL